MGDATILVVDDESRMRKLIKDFLIQKNYNILEAEDGERALKVYEENKEKIDRPIRSITATVPALVSNSCQPRPGT